MNKQSGFSLIELLIVITIMGVIVTISLPSFRNFNQEKSLSNSINMVKDDIQFGINKSSSGVNGKWYGIAFESDSSSKPLNYTFYTNFEIIARNENNEVVCSPNIFDISKLPCSDPYHQQKKERKYSSGVKLDKIVLFDKEANPIDYPSFIDVRFNQSPNSGQIIIGSTSTNSDLQAQIARAELIYRNENYERSLVIDGGNICDSSQVDTSACNSNLTGGPKPGRVFIVER